MDKQPSGDLSLDPIASLDRINRAFHALLSTTASADLSPAHKTDDLMVWFLLGGKDVGKSTFLNALLDTEVSGEPPESAEGTCQFVAYIHESSRRELEERLQDLPIDIRFHAHNSEPHQRLCLIDSPDFDSRFERHASQVAQVLQAGAADGAVLLASPEKYKNMAYWGTFQTLSQSLSPRHILFVLTKADELGDYLNEVRNDFGRTVSQRMSCVIAKDKEDTPEKGDGRVFLINSLERSIDFSSLESRLLQKLSFKDVRHAQQENLRHAITLGVERIRGHYQLDEIRQNLEDAADPQRTDEICQEHFPDPYLLTVASRMADNREIAARVRERFWLQPGGTLAGIPAIQSALHWIASRNPFRIRNADSTQQDRAESTNMVRLVQWGEEDLDTRLSRARHQVFSGLWLEHPGAVEPFMEEQDSVTGVLAQRLEDLLAQPARKALSLPWRLVLNLPVYLYLLFFLSLLFSPFFLLLKAWHVPYMPDMTNMLTLDNVKVGVIGFCGYYIMAVLFVLRKQRDRVHREMEVLAQHFTSDMLSVLRESVRQPIARFQAAFNRLEDLLLRLPLP